MGRVLGEPCLSFRLPLKRVVGVGEAGHLFCVLGPSAVDPRETLLGIVGQWGSGAAVWGNGVAVWGSSVGQWGSGVGQEGSSMGQWGSGVGQSYGAWGQWRGARGQRRVRKLGREAMV